MQYVYPCVIEREKPNLYGGYFPDVSGAYAAGETLYEVLLMAEDALNGMLESMEDDGDEILPPTPLEKVKLEDGEFVTLIKADTDAYRKTLT